MRVKRNYRNRLRSSWLSWSEKGLRPEQSSEDFPNLLTHEKIKKIGDKYKKSNAQVMLRHFVQEGVVVIPKSTNPKRLKENLSIYDFELSEEDIAELESLDKGLEGRIFNYKFFKG